MLDFDAASPADPDASQAWVLLLYGATMLSIQNLEYQLAFLAVVATFSPEPSDLPLRERLDLQFKRFHKAFQRDTAGPTVKKLNGRIPDDLHDDLRTFFRVRRNSLAHSFLLERLVRDGDGASRFAKGTVRDLVSTASEASKLLRRVEEETTKQRAALPKAREAPPPEVQEWIHDMLRLVTLNQVRSDLWADFQKRP